MPDAKVHTWVSETEHHERIAKALESIAASLSKIANPIVYVPRSAGITDADLERKL